MDDPPFFDPLFTPPPVPQVDRLPVRGATEDMIDLSRVNTHIRRAVDLNRYDGPTDPILYLLHQACLINVSGTRIPSLAGLLCFGHTPQTILPWAYVDLVHYRGLLAISDEVVHLAKNIGGTIFEQLDHLRRYLWASTRHGMTVNGFERVDLHEYPEVVIRELGVNMLAHRDYAFTKSQARIMMFADRIEWSNPGGLPEGVTPENILRKQHSRNPTIQTILHQAGYVEALGQGLDTVVAVLQRDRINDDVLNDDVLNPRFEDLGDTFIVTVFGRADGFDSFSAASGLKPAQRQLFDFIRQRGEVTTMAAIARFHRSQNTILRDLRVLIDAGLVEPVGDARSRRYRLVSQTEKSFP